MGIDVRKVLDSYEFTTDLPGNGKTIKFKPLTTGTIKKSLVYEDEENIETLENFLDSLVSNCVLNDDFNIDNLLLQDRFHLLVEIRKRSKGNVFKFPYTCSVCNLESIQTVDLSKLEVTKKPENIDDVVQVSDKLFLYLKHITRGEQKEAFKNIDSDLPLTKRMVEVATYSYALSIYKMKSGEEEDENVSIDDKIYVLDSLEDEKYNKVMDWFKDNDFGVDFSYKVKCKNPKCKENNKEINRRIPLSNFFG